MQHTMPALDGRGQGRTVWQADWTPEACFRAGRGTDCMVSPCDEAEQDSLMLLRNHLVAVVGPQQPGLLPASSRTHDPTPCHRILVFCHGMAVATPHDLVDAQCYAQGCQSASAGHQITSGHDTCGKTLSAAVAAETLPGGWCAGRILGCQDPLSALSSGERLSNTKPTSLRSRSAAYLGEGRRKRFLTSNDLKI